MSNMFIKHQGKFDEAGIANICPLCGSKIDLSIAMTLEAEQDPNVVYDLSKMRRVNNYFYCQ